MKITNVHNVPEPLVTLAKGQYYSKGAAQYSVTELMSPPRVRRLQERHDELREQDVSDMLWPLLGSALHVVMERGETEGWISWHPSIWWTFPFGIHSARWTTSMIV
jgi:hypothetical protein